jgi:hypothetical protein
MLLELVTIIVETDNGGGLEGPGTLLFLRFHHRGD